MRVFKTVLQTCKWTLHHFLYSTRCTVKISEEVCRLVIQFNPNEKRKMSLKTCLLSIKRKLILFLTHEKYCAYITIFHYSEK